MLVSAGLAAWGFHSCSRRMNSPEVDLALELKVLQAENARLISLLESHAIE